MPSTPPNISTLIKHLPNKAGGISNWGELHGGSVALAIAESALQHDGLLLAITPDSHDALALESELQFFTADSNVDILVFPDWETLPYDVFSPHQDIISQRLATLYRLPSQKRGILIVPVATLLQRLSPRSYLDAHALMLEGGDQIEPDAFRRRLDAAGYQCVSQVRERGEFAVRGALIDLFPMGSEYPYRVDLFDEDIESLRSFDPETQLSIEVVDKISLLPAREFSFAKESVTHFRNAFRTRFPGDPSRSPVYKEVSNGVAIAGVEYYLPLFFEHTETLFDYLPANTLATVLQGADNAITEFTAELGERYEQCRHDAERPILPPADLFMDADTVRSALAEYPRVNLQHAATEAGRGRNLATAALPDITLNRRAEQPATALKNMVDEFDGRVLFIAESAGRRELLIESLREQDINLHACASWQAFLGREDKTCITVAPLESGWIQADASIAIITESALYGERTRQQKPSKGRDAEAVIRDLTDLSDGAPVVHEEHGVGRYAGLQSMDIDGQPTEFVVLEYAKDSRLFVPVSSLHMISRYTGASPENAPLHRLGGDQWEKAKRKAAERVRDVAAELLDVYARRESRPGHVFECSETEYRQFADAFPFAETVDQASAIEAVVDDMRSERPMDRVVCGDVGFGKTEVAMRAAFMAVQGGKQVAVLVPTTLLAQQHYQNFMDRFADWPVRVDMLSRFRSKKEEALTLDALAAGKADIVIGTHKLLQGGIRFKRLGLVIIDEEHRFGVRQKERFKALRSEVDMLTLTATPIPRTLNMAMAGLRDLSIIATPPAQRLAVKTIVSQENKALILESCQRELKRGGQIYFLHNDVESIERKAKELEDLVPGARVAVGHGQMRESELERVMMDFYHQRCNLLVCTTIIESGIDVPSANTIIINRADKLGLAQLHQLRGRVGRSHHRAYAYLIVPNRKAMTRDAVKRIEAIESLEDLGAGFMLASHDLEIRGAGELLGDEQSGQMHEIGFTLYTELLERAIKALKSGKTPDLESPFDHGPEVDLRVPALIPDDYLPDVHSRLVLYKRIASAVDNTGLKDLQVEMIDRFGLLPEPVKNLFAVTQLKLIATPIGVKKVELGENGGRVIFNAKPKIDIDKVFRFFQSQAGRYKLEGQDTIRVNRVLSDVGARLQDFQNLIGEIGV